MNVASVLAADNANLQVRVEPPVGIEPTTYSLRATRSHVHRRPSTYENPGQRPSRDLGVRRRTTSN
jgi:hypothetical protein